MESNEDKVNTLYHLINTGFIFLILIGVILCATSVQRKERQLNLIIDTSVIISISAITFLFIGQHIYNSDNIIMFIKKCIFFSYNESRQIYTLIDLSLCILASVWVLTALAEKIKIKHRLILASVFSGLIYPFFSYILPSKIDFHNYHAVFFIICSATFLSLLSHTKKQAQTDSHIIHTPKLFTIGGSIIFLCWLGLAAELAFLQSGDFNFTPTIVCVLTAIIALFAYRILLNHKINNHLYLSSIIVTLIAFGSPAHSGYLAAIITGIIIPPLTLTTLVSFRFFDRIHHLASIILLGTLFGIVSIILKQPLSIFSTVIDSGIIFILTYLITSLAMMIILSNQVEKNYIGPHPDETNSECTQNTNFEENIVSDIKHKIITVLEKNKPKNNFLKPKPKAKPAQKKSKLKGSRSQRKKIRHVKENRQ